MHRTAQQWSQTSEAQLANGPDLLRQQFLEDYQETFQQTCCLSCPNQLGAARRKLIEKLTRMQTPTNTNPGWKLHPHLEGMPLIAAETHHNAIHSHMITDPIAALIVTHSPLHEQAFEQVPPGVSFDAQHRILWPNNPQQTSPTTQNEQQTANPTSKKTK